MSKRRKFVFVHVGHSTDQVLCGRLLPIVEECGLELVTLNVSDDDFTKQFKGAVASQLDEVAALGSINQYLFLHKTSDDTFLHQACGLPVVLLSLDHPALLMPPAARCDKQVVCVFNSPSHEEYWRRHLQAENKSFIECVLPFSGLINGGDLSYEAYLARKPEGLCALNLYHMEETLETMWMRVADWEDAPRLVALTAVDAMATTDNMSALDAVDTAMELHAIELTAEELAHAVCWTEAIVKVWRRDFVLRNIIDSPITFSTPHTPPYYWPRHRDKFINTFGPETLEICPQYRVHINVNPPFPGCVHDRVANCVEAGALLFSNVDFGLERVLTPGRDFVPYNYGDKNITEALDYYLAHPRESYEMAMSARETWAQSDVPGQAYKKAIEYAVALRDS